MIAMTIGAIVFCVCATAYALLQHAVESVCGNREP